MKIMFTTENFCKKLHKEESETEKMKKQTYDLEERLLEYSVRIVKKDILQGTEGLIKIFVTSIKTAEKKRK